MKQDIRDLFKQDTLSKKKLPDLHREDFLEKLQEIAIKSPTKKRFYTKLKVAVSIAAIITIIIMLQKHKTNSIEPINKVVVSPVDSNLIDSEKNSKINKGVGLVEVKKKAKITIETSNKETKNTQKNKMVFNKNEVNKELKFIHKPIVEEPELVIINELIVNKEFNKVDTLKIASNDNGGIKVNSSALLYSITHSKNEILAYYKDNDLTRASVIKDIEYELNKSSLAINAEELLIEIEYGLNKKSFKEKLLANIKLKIKELSNTIVTN